jgi:hypothetical protein
MSLLTIANVAKSYAANRLCTEITFNLAAGQKRLTPIWLYGRVKSNASGGAKAMSSTSPHTEPAPPLDEAPDRPNGLTDEQVKELLAAAGRRKNDPASVKRIGPQDCRIAAQALAHGLIVITRNLRDFNAIGAPCEDWST